MFTRSRSHQKCQCFIIPDHIMEQLARNGVESARVSVSKSNQIREKRRRKMYDIEGVVALTDAESCRTQESARHVYDCQGGTDLRKHEARTEGGDSTGDVSVDQVYDFAGITRDYFKKVLNRNSIDNKGLDLVLNVHYGKNYNNAFWDGDEMVFGDGDNMIFTSFTKSLDVIAHELAHGVTQFTADLEYYGQSGALNEHFSDAFGSAIKQYHLGQTAQEADWLIGAEIMGPSLEGQALRSMKAPGTAYDNPLLGKDPQPDHMDHYYKGSRDNAGVHINSGIPNKVFYLVSMEIGTHQAALIWYQALQKLWNTAQFDDFAQVVVAAAKTLSESGEVPETAAEVVESALQEVGISQKVATVNL